MRWRSAVNSGLARAIGYELRRTPAGSPAAGTVGAREGDRLVKRPAFVLCTVRSGSTLLRVLLDSHSDIHAPHELHLRDLAVGIRSPYAERALEGVGLGAHQLEHLLWDRLLHRELAASGKRLLVNKTPSDVFIADRIAKCWPDARFIFLLRHPAAIARSRQQARPQDDGERNAAMVVRYGEALEAARRTHSGITVHYEELVSDPRATLEPLCNFLGVRWEPQMLEYGRFQHGPYRPGLGDWKDKIRSGRIQAHAPPPEPEQVAPALRPLCEAWGYPLEDEDPAPVAGAVRRGS